MNYNKILKQIAKKENTTPAEVEREMSIAIKLAGFDCSVKEFLETATALLKKDYKSHIV